jgi:hypothetical protein
MAYNGHGQPYRQRASAIHRKPAALIEYALSYGTFRLAELRMTSRVYSKTVALGPIVEVTRNAGAATRV